jgi:uncharacterized protein YjbI with pentapeptide repeats
MRKPVDLGFDDLGKLGEIDFPWSFFKTHVLNEDFSYSDLSKASIMRSLVENVNFSGICGHPIRLTWNDIVCCDFTDADLTGTAMGGSLIKECRFFGSYMQNLDLRTWSFCSNCTFDSADLEGALVTLKQYLFLPLSKIQRSRVRWKFRQGRLPPD